MESSIMKKSDLIKFDALKQMHNKYMVTFTLNAVTGTLYDIFDDEEAVKNELIQMDAKHDKDINAVLSANEYDDISYTPIKGKKRVLTKKGEQDLIALTKEDDRDIEKNSAQ